MHLNQTYGWVPDFPDGRDFLYQTIRRKVLRVPLVFGFTVYESFESEVVARSGVVAMPYQYLDALADDYWTIRK